MKFLRNVAGVVAIACLVGVALAEEPPTIPPCVKCTLPLEVDPVCGTDSKTYANACLAQCKDVEIAHEGKCEPGGDCPCTKELDPQCGADGKTYHNPCLAKCANAEPTTPGPCKVEK